MSSIFKWKIKILFAKLKCKHLMKTKNNDLSEQQRSDTQFRHIWTLIWNASFDHFDCRPNAFRVPCLCMILIFWRWGLHIFNKHVGSLHADVALRIDDPEIWHYNKRRTKTYWFRAIAWPSNFRWIEWFDRTIVIWKKKQWFCWTQRQHKNARKWKLFMFAMGKNACQIVLIHMSQSICNLISQEHTRPR